jgi:hypothetical protein
VGFGLYAFASDDLLGRFLMFNTSDLRYSGWSLNPNQLALFLLPLPIWLVAIFTTRLNLTAVPRLFFGTLFFAIILMGFLIRSDGLFVVWIGGFILLAVLIYLWVGRVSKLHFLIGFAIVIASAVIIKIFAHGDVRTTVNCSYNYVLSKEENWKGKCLDERFFKDEELYRIGFTDPNSKIIIRRVLWSHGLDVWLTSPFIGWGPGEYSWLDTEIEGVRTELMESHNILVDLLTQGGLLVGIAWILVVLNLLVKSWRAKDPFTFVVVFVVLMFTFFHNTRQPYLWFVLAISSVVVRRNIFALSTNKPVL